MNWTLHFLGVGAAHAVELGSSAVVLERDGAPVLLIDCGPDTLDRYLAAYGEPRTRTWITSVAWSVCSSAYGSTRHGEGVPACSSMPA
jgi:ribonuclease BN (tRNA processing enzyme)